MRAVAWVIIGFVFHWEAGAQVSSLDSVNREATYQWLERKLTFNYFDVDNQQWWVNRCFINDAGEVRIKNISTNDPLEVENRKFHERIFHFSDINYRKIEVQKMAKSSGRFVKGQVIRLRGFQDETDISTRIQRKTGSKLAFVDISIPEYLNDSLNDYASTIATKLRQSARLASKLPWSENFNRKTQSLDEVFHGYFADSLSGNTWHFERLTPGYYAFTSESDPPILGTLIIDQTSNQFFGQLFYNNILGAGFLSESYAENHLKLFVESDKSLVINVLDRHTIEFHLADAQWRLIRK